VEVVANYLVLDGQEFNCAFVRDISERKRAEEGARRREEELRERDALMRTIAEHYPNAYVSIIEKDLTVGFTSGQAFKNRGLDANQFVGRTLDEVFGEWAPTVKAHYLRSFAGDEQSFTLEIHGEHQHYRSVPLRDAAGAIERILSVVEVIDERVRAEEQLQSSAALLAFSQGLTHTGSWELDAATQQLMWSDETYRIFGAVPQSFGATYDAFLEMVHPRGGGRRVHALRAGGIGRVRPRASDCSERQRRGAARPRGMPARARRGGTRPSLRRRGAGSHGAAEVARRPVA
jgi:PAS domain-containing protein